MSIDIIENVFMLLAAIIGLLLVLFKYIETPMRGWLFISVFYLTHLLSDYYWTTYTLVMGENPKVSAFMAYFGWNVGYLFLLLAALTMRNPAAKGYFHPLMLLPIPINLAQFAIYLPFGGIVNNVWEGFFATAISCFCLQSLLYFYKNRSTGISFPWTHAALLLFIILEYCMWTTSCFFWNVSLKNPYYYFAFAESAVLILLPWAAAKDYNAAGFTYRKRSTEEKRFQILLQAVVTTIIFFGCIGGYYVANLMKKTLAHVIGDNGDYRTIALTLFVISILLVVLILLIIFMTALHYRKVERHVPEVSAEKLGRFNFAFTLIITLFLMIFSVVYTSRLFYHVSVTVLREDGAAKASSTSNELENYLGVARSILWATADTVDLMVKNGDSPDKIRNYLVDQTTNQKKQFDENFTGLYAYIDGEYLDGLGWVPPENYDAEKRDWYRSAVDANGETVITSPYVDAQTHSVVVTICKLLEDSGKDGSYKRRNVVALDMVVNHIQDVTQQVNLGHKGYGMVLNRDGLIIAHRDPKLNGQNITDILGRQFMDDIIKTNKGTVETLLNGEDYTLFIGRVIEQWYVVIAVKNSKLYQEVHSQLFVNITVSLIIFMLISFFYYLSYKNERLTSKKMSELKSSGLKQEYESRILKLEKLAADEANKAKSRFLADMSHEIRTPINAILGMNEMVLRESRDPDIHEYAKNIRVSGRNLLQLINSILDFSKIEDGKMEIIPVTYSTSAMITYLLNSVQERAREKNLELILHIDPTLPRELYGDDARINQAIINLLTNAVKYTKTGSVSLTMEAKKKDGNRLLLFVEVRDTGIGIRESDMGKLFESFERLDLAKNRNIEGTGLGMSITSSLLKLMDSELKVESVYGEGSAFSFEIWQEIRDGEHLGDYRLVSPDEEDEDIYTPTLLAPTAQILIVDDTRMNLLVATSLLKRTKIQIDTAASGDEALRLADEKAYDVILMDQLMPGMDGTQTLKKIRALTSRKNIVTPVICLTADAIRGAKERLLGEGFTDYLSKPVDGRTLEKKLLSYLPKEKLENPEKEAAVQEENRNSDILPEDSLSTETVTEEPDKLMEALAAAGVQTSTGMEYCMNERDIYEQILEEYATSAKTRRKALQDYFDTGDWENYAIYIHSLKSTSRTIGAEELSVLAAGLESAAKDGNEAALRTDHEKAMALYDTTTAAIRDGMELSEPLDSEDGDDDEGIFEFAPQ